MTTCTHTSASASSSPPPPPPPSSSSSSSSSLSRRELARSTKPIPCYAVDQLPPKRGGDELYESLSTLVNTGQAQLIEEIIIPPRDAKTWTVKAGQLWRIVCHAGPQVADMNVWNYHNYDEHFYSSKTRQMHATHVTTGDRLWSNMPYLRPLATIIHDTINYGFDDDGAGVHDVIGSRCDPYTHKLLTNTEFHRTCHSNLTRSCYYYHHQQQQEEEQQQEQEQQQQNHNNNNNNNLTELHVHDVLNVFMCTGFTKDTHQYFTKPSPVDVGDYIEFLAETDVLVAASTCPQGDVSLACGSTNNHDDDDDQNNNNNNNNDHHKNHHHNHDNCGTTTTTTTTTTTPQVYPLKVQIYSIIPEGYLQRKGWKPSEVSTYSRNHGIS